MSKLYLATRKGLFILAKHNSTWQITKTAFLGDELSMLLPDPRDGSLYVAFHHGHFGCKLHRSTDDGTTWTEIACPAFPPQPEGLVDTDGWGKPIAWKVVKIWALEAGGTPGELWCGTLPGTLHLSRDHGRTWEWVKSLWDHPGRKNWMGGGADLPGIHSICVDPNDGNTVFVGVSCGGVWKTTDGGATWDVKATGMRAEWVPPEKVYEPTIQDAHRLAQCRANPNSMWVQHHNGIFSTIDHAETWRECENVKPSAFGFAVVAHPTDAKTAWFVPGIKDEKRIPVDGKLVVTRTRDGGQTFEVLSEGLPQTHAYDLVYRHAMDIDDAGTTLAFGSTTGNVWVSENSGDSWMQVASNLPPIYCVRFGP